MNSKASGEHLSVTPNGRKWAAVVPLVWLASISLSLSQFSGEWNLALAFAVGAAALLTAVLGLRLPRGDVVRVDALAASAALAFLSPAVGMAALFAGSVGGMLLARKVTKSTFQWILVDASRHGFVLWVAYHSRSALGGLDASSVVLTGLAVATYASLELLSLTLQTSAMSGASWWGVAASMTRSVWQIYLGQACLGVALVAVYPAMGAWSIPVMTILGAILLNGFALYLRVKVAYQETIAALARVSELHLAGRRGHAAEVASIALAAGRRLGLNAHQLEALNYAALLHEIGTLGRDVTGAVAHDEVSEWAETGAAILRAVPFLSASADMVGCQHSLTDESATGRTREAQLGGAIIRASCLAEERRRATDSDCVQERGTHLKPVAEIEETWIPHAVTSVVAAVQSRSANH